MAEFSAVKTLSDTVDSVAVPLVQPSVRRILVAGVTGTFVGTLKIQKSTDNGKTWADASVVAVASSGAAAGNPTAPGNFAADLGVSATHGRVIFSAYTSGTARVSALVIPFI